MKTNPRKRLFSGLIAMLLILCSFMPTVDANAAPKKSLSENNSAADAGMIAEEKDASCDATDSLPPTETENEDEIAAETVSGNETPKTEIKVRFYNQSVSVENLIYEFTIPFSGASVSLKNILPEDAVDTLLSPVRNGHQLYQWVTLDGQKDYKPNKVYSRSLTTDTDYIAQWRNASYVFAINYHFDGGRTGEGDYRSSFRVSSETITLSDPIRKGYRFGGWFTDPAFTKKVSSIPAGTYIDSDKTTGEVDDYHLYAKWIKVNPGTPTISSAKNSASGKATIKWKSVKDVKGYELVISQDAKFKKNTNKLDLGSKTSYTLTNLPKNKTYYFKVRSYQEDSTGATFYGSYSKVKPLKIKKGVKEYTAKKGSAKLKKVRVKNQTELNVEATVAKRLKSSDDSYYLVKVDPVKGTVTKKLAGAPKNKNVSFTLPLKDEKGTNLIQGKFAIAVKNGKKFKVISSASFIDNPQDAAAYTAEFPTAASKKGLQGNLNNALGIHHTYINIMANDMIAAKGSGTPYKYNGKTYYFNDFASGFISQANSMGMTVSGQIMLRWGSSASNKLILKSGRSGGHNYYAFDAQSKESRETLEALFCFMAERWSRENCHLDNWILGNEVNIHPMWYYAGNISTDNFMKNYADTYRILYYAVKGSSKNSRVYICTDHTWINRSGDWGARPFMDLFDKKIKAQNKNIKWNLAYHAYPSVLTNSKVWDDNADPRFTTANTVNSDFVSPYNLDVLTDYVKKNFGSDTHIILSEQGFTAGSGTNVQAAAIAYSYYKAEFNDMIDAFILYDAYINNAEDYSLTDKSGKRRPAYEVFMYMNSPSYEKYTNSCLKTMGYASWKEVTGKFDANKLKKMPAR